jgi:hypothetical protein
MEASTGTKATQIAAILREDPSDKFKSVAHVNKKYDPTVCPVSFCFYLFYSGRVDTKDLSGALSLARDLPRNEQQLPLIEIVQARKNPGDNFMLTSNPIHSGHGYMIETCFIAHVVTGVLLISYWSRQGVCICVFWRTGGYGHLFLTTALDGIRGGEVG